MNKLFLFSALILCCCGSDENPKFRQECEQDQDKISIYKATFDACVQAKNNGESSWVEACKSAAEFTSCKYHVEVSCDDSIF